MSDKKIIEPVVEQNIPAPMKINKSFLISAAVIFIASLLVLLITLLSLLPKKTQVGKRAQVLSLTPLKVQVSNIFSRGFTVSWVTNGKTSGALVYGETKANLESVSTTSPIKDDTRGSGNYQTHFVTINNLTPGKRYYYKIRSGEKYYLNNIADGWKETGFSESVLLPNETFTESSATSSNNSPGSYSSEGSAFSSCSGVYDSKVSCYRPNLVYGKVVYNNNSTAITEAVVFVEIPGKTNLLSALTDKNGKWNLNLANFLKNDLSAYTSYQPGTDLLKISAITSFTEEGSLYQPIPPVAKTYQDPSNPITVSINYSPQSTPAITAATTPTVIPTSKPSVPSSTLTLQIKLQGQNTAGSKNITTLTFIKDGKILSTQKITLIFQKGIFSGTSNITRLGSHLIKIKPVGYLGRTVGPITLVSGKNPLDFSQTEFLAGDLNNDNLINSQDISLIMEEINGVSKTLLGDFNADGKVSTEDLAILVTNYRKTGE